jgi:hypothetical protein
MPVAEWGRDRIGTVLVSDDELALLVELSQQPVRVVGRYGLRCRYPADHGDRPGRPGV